MSLRILFLSHVFSPSIGGIEVNSEIFAQAFSAAGHEVHVMTWTEDNTCAPFPYKVIRNPTIVEIFKEHRWADVIFENNPCLRLSWPNIFFKRPLTVSLNIWITRNDGSIALQDVLKRFWLKRAKKVIAVSNAIRKKTWSQATVIGNPFRSNIFKLIPNVAKEYDYIFLGRLVSDKGADMAIRAIHRLITSASTEKQNKKPTLTIVGDGPERENLKRLVAKLEIEDSVRFTGFLQGDELVFALNQHRYLLVPSVWEEPFGNVALEGLACGCLPIVSDGGGLPDAVGKAGAIFKRGNLDSLIEVIWELRNNPEIERRLRKEAKHHLQLHSPEIVSEKYLKLIEDTLKVRRELVITTK
ncbi:glycosyltransferase family 4 protein [Pontibacter harenae]|uniref:glycosyltransferase family 4 protein n=1 Tax=Pontibacter harenae TaxID=2894083 RepID=UPI001E4FA612|nr:glycosyltransferase family 4 protein [Pontibacter harenae]MCC9167206.1 glycosyltransferase family 4 protein [Pontibacter harenae]